MKKIFFILLGVLFSLNIAFAQKTVSYQLNYSFDKDSSAFAKNYSCNLKNLENDSAQLIRQEKWGDLLVVFDKCIAQYPTYPYLYNNRGNAYKTMYKLEEALIDYEKAIELDSEYINPYIGKASVLILQSEYEKAINILNQVLEKGSKEGLAYYYKGLAFYYIDNKEEALKNFSLGIKYSKKPILEYYFYRGNLYYSYKNDYNNAIKDYNKCINIINKQDKNFIMLNSIGDVYFNRSLAYYHLGKNKEMLEDLIRALNYYKQENNQKGYEMVKSIFKSIVK